MSLLTLSPHKSSWYNHHIVLFGILLPKFNMLLTVLTDNYVTLNNGMTSNCVFASIHEPFGTTWSENAPYVPVLFKHIMERKHNTIYCVYVYV